MEKKCADACRTANSKLKYSCRAYEFTYNTADNREKTGGAPRCAIWNKVPGIFPAGSRCFRVPIPQNSAFLARSVVSSDGSWQGVGHPEIVLPSGRRPTGQGVRISAGEIPSGGSRRCQRWNGVYRFLFFCDSSPDLGRMRNP